MPVLRRNTILLAVPAVGLLVSCGPAPSPAVPSTPLEELAAAAVPLDDNAWGPLDHLVGDAEVVMLGEPWHGDGSAMAERARIVRHLHEQLGFDVLVFEADFFAVHQAWNDARRTGALGDVKDQIYPFWTDVQAMAPLWAYVEEQLHGPDTLHIAGIDTKLVGTRSTRELPGLLAQRLARLADVPKTDAEKAAGTLHAALDPQAGDTSLLTGGNFALMERLLQRADAAPGTDPFEAQWINSVKRNVQGEQRDPGMGANLFQLMTQQYPGRKVIVWAHNNHVATDKWMVLDAPGMEGVPTTDADRASFTFLGDAARHCFGARLVSIATIVHEGLYSVDIAAALGGIGTSPPADLDSTATLAPAPAGTLEHALAERGLQRALLDLRGFPHMYAVPTRVLDYSSLPPQSLCLSKGYDGLLFLRRTHGLNDVPAIGK